MSRYTALIRWERGSQPFVDNQYDRGHMWRFDGGTEVPASSSPSIVPFPMSRADAVDPEEAFVASVSSCHMLFFLSLAAKKGFVVDSYEDNAVGIMEKDANGKLAITRLNLEPWVVFSGTPLPERHQIEELHHVAHESCFIANSILTAISCKPRFEIRY